MIALDLDPGKRWLFAMTHPDDEMAVSAWIRRLARVGAEVFMNWTHSTPVREAEARIVASRMEIPDERMSFMAAPDGAICDEASHLRPSFEGLIERVQPDRIACCAFEQGHLDHDATNLLVNSVFTGPVLEWPMYHAYLGPYQKLAVFADPTGEEIIDLDDEERAFKRALLDCWPSQTIKRNVVAYEWLWRLRGKPARLIATERLRVQTHKDFRAPNLPSPLRERVLRCRNWARWIAAVDAFEGAVAKR